MTINGNIEATRRELEARIETTRQDLEARIETARRELEAGIEATRGELFTAFRWLVGFIITSNRAQKDSRPLKSLICFSVTAIFVIKLMRR